MSWLDLGLVDLSGVLHWKRVNLYRLFSRIRMLKFGFVPHIGLTDHYFIALFFFFVKWL